jgi:hypothetical protein
MLPRPADQQSPVALHRHRPNPRPNSRLVLVQDLQIRIVHAATGDLLRELILEPTKRYKGTGRPPGPTR